MAEGRRLTQRYRAARRTMWAPLPVLPMRRQPPPGSASRRPAVPQCRGTASCRPAGRAMLHLVAVAAGPLHQAAAAAAQRRLPAAAAVPHDCLAAAEAPTLLKHWSLLATAAPLPTWQRSTNNLSQAPDNKFTSHAPTSFQTVCPCQKANIIVWPGSRAHCALRRAHSFSARRRSFRSRSLRVRSVVACRISCSRCRCTPRSSVNFRNLTSLSASWILGILLTCTGTTRRHMMLAAV